MTQLEAKKIVVCLSAMTHKDMVKAMAEDAEFQKLHDELLANGWATLAEGVRRRKDGKIVCTMRLVRGDDPEWLRLKPSNADMDVRARGKCGARRNFLQGTGGFGFQQEMILI